MSRSASVSAAFLFLLSPIVSPMSIGLTSAVGIGAEVLSPQVAYAQSAEDWFKSARAKASSRDYEEAIDDYTKALTINPEFADAYFHRGILKGRLGDAKGAISDADQAIKINPQHAMAYASRGIAEESLGDLQRACADWRKAAVLGNTYASKMVRKQC